jgi:hypothetical protein
MFSIKRYNRKGQMIAAADGTLEEAQAIVDFAVSIAREIPQSGNLTDSLFRDLRAPVITAVLPRGQSDGAAFVAIVGDVDSLAHSDRITLVPLQHYANDELNCSDARMAAVATNTMRRTHDSLQEC